LTQSGRRRFLAGGVLACLTLPHPPVSAGAALDPAQLAAGDWIFRRTTSIPGYLSGHIDPVGEFSHVGIACPFLHGWQVIHAVPAESGEPGGVRADSLNEFCEAADVRLIAQARLSKATAGQQLAMAEMARRLIGKPFDITFNSADDSRLYCTELVWRVSEAAGIQLHKPLQSLRTILGEFNVVTLSALSAQPDLRWLQRSRA
jgi:hypothetical protein